MNSFFLLLAFLIEKIILDNASLFDVIGISYSPFIHLSANTVIIAISSHFRSISLLCVQLEALHLFSSLGGLGVQVSKIAKQC
jgi:hypothetical protein